MNPQSPEEWLALVRRHEAAARNLAEDRIAAGAAYYHVGMAVECALKAYIMWKERPNRWEDLADEKGLRTHDLRKLASIAGIELRTDDPIGPSWAVVLQWDRSQGYDPRPMPRRVARSNGRRRFC